MFQYFEKAKELLSIVEEKEAPKKPSTFLAQVTLGS
jgi:hypothetical protein